MQVKAFADLIVGDAESQMVKYVSGLFSIDEVLFQV
jgi:hypothetical protein